MHAETILALSKADELKSLFFGGVRPILKGAQVNRSKRFFRDTGWGVDTSDQVQAEIYDHKQLELPQTQQKSGENTNHTPDTKSLRAGPPVRQYRRVVPIHSQMVPPTTAVA